MQVCSERARPAIMRADWIPCPESLRKELFNENSVGTLSFRSSCGPSFVVVQALKASEGQMKPRNMP